MTKDVLGYGLLALLIGATSASAQVLDLPPRPYRGLFGGAPAPDPNRSRQDLEIHGNFLGGYEDNLVPPGGNTFLSYPPGFTGFGDATVRYTVGKLTRSLELGGSGFVNTYRNIGVGPSYGGYQMLNARTDLGRRTTLVVHERVTYTPYFSVRLFDSAPLAPVARDSQVAPAPTQATNPLTALAPTGSWLTNAAAALDHNFTRTVRMNAGYSFDQQRYVDNIGYDSTTHSGILGFDEDLTRTASVRASYRFASSEFVQANGSSYPLETNTIEVGPGYRKRVSRTRQIMFAGGVGAVRSHLVEVRSGLTIDEWSPSGYATMRYDLGRSWNVAADYRRAVAALQGTRPEAFVSDTASLVLGGFISRTVESIFTIGYSNGSNLPSPSLLELGKYEGFNGSAQVRFRASRFLSVLVSGSRYQYRLNAAAAESLRVPQQLDRNAIRVGITWSLPLVGTYLDDPRSTGGRD